MALLSVKNYDNQGAIVVARHLALKSEIESVNSAILELEKRYHALRSVVAVDSDTSDSSDPHSLSVGCVTFSAFGGIPVIDQIIEESIKWKESRARARARSSTHRWLEVELSVMEGVDRVLVEYVEKERGAVPPGKVRQYFVGISADKQKRVFDVIELDEDVVANLIFARGRRRGDLVSTALMTRGKSFFTEALEAQVESLKGGLLSLKSELEGVLEKHLEFYGKHVSGPHMWSESLTDEHSRGGFLILTADENNNTLDFCPYCFSDLEGAFRSGARNIVWPALPNLYADMEVYCTENKHRNHSRDECLGVEVIESKINDLRKSLGIKWHRTEICKIPNKNLNDIYGDWLWLKMDP